MNIDRFKDSPAGRLVKSFYSDKTYWAFVPNRLPPTLDADWGLTRQLSEAGRALGELNGLGRAIPNPRLLMGPFIRREAVLSSRIEGTETDLAGLYAYEAGQLMLPGLMDRPVVKDDAQEVVNYIHALEYGLKRIASLPVSRRLLCELHERLMAGVRGREKRPGQFREKQNYITGRGGAGIETADFVPPPVAEMQTALDDFERYVNEDDGHLPLARLAMIHYQFEAIHPFEDGNGRIGRLMITLLLMHWKLLELPLLYLSAYFERNREMYYDLLLAVSERGAWREWLSFFLQGVREQSRDAIARVKALQDLQADWRRRVAQARRSALLPVLVDYLFERPVLTIPQVAEKLDVKYVSAQNNIGKLVEAGILQPLGEASYNRTFVARDILQIALTNEP